MKNAIKAGLIIGIVSAIWIMIMHLVGYNPADSEDTTHSWLEYTSVLIPLIGLYFGIRSFRTENGGNLTFIEGVFEGFKIMMIGGLLAGACSAIYLAFFNETFSVDYLDRVFGAIIIGLLFTLVNSLLLMTTPKQI